MVRIYTLKEEAKNEAYEFIHKYLRKLPRNDDGSFNEFASGFNDNDVDALRHAYVSGVYTMEYSDDTAEKLGRLQELVFADSSSTHPQSENMDLWNNSVGRKYGKKAKTREELFKLLHEALKNGELIENPNDLRKYKGEKFLKRIPKSLVIKIEESKSGENILFYDINTKKIMSKEEFLAAIKFDKYPNYSFKTVDGVEVPISKRDRFKFNNLG
ncbi:MAG: hypothetical protein HON90_09925 [Halobacteriovoraceae bacterium]|mgnify:FL=1|jgi:hypothetical protein|nr:hypothetical protein [Halobacteriovoraceae bacterium]